MPDELPDVPALRMLTPPAGGLAALRDRIDEAPPRRRRWWLAAVPSLAVATALVVALVLVRRPERRAPVPMPTALRDLQVGRDVAFYWVASSPGAPRATRTSTERPEVAPAIAIDAVSRVAYLQLP